MQLCGVVPSCFLPASFSTSAQFFEVVRCNTLVGLTHGVRECSLSACLLLLLRLVVVSSGIFGAGSLRSLFLLCQDAESGDTSPGTSSG